MGIVIAPAQSFKASGNVGTLNFMKNGVVRARTTAVQPNTAGQIASQTKLSAIVTLWGSTLTNAQRLGWRKFARGILFTNRLNQKNHPSGYMSFVRTNLRLDQCGMTRILDAPLWNEVPEACWLSAAWNVSLGSVVYALLDLDGTLLHVDGGSIFRAGPYSSPGRLAQPNEYYWHGNRAWAGNYQDTTTSSGKYYTYKARWMMSNGQTGQWCFAEVAIP